MLMNEADIIGPHSPSLISTIELEEAQKIGEFAEYCFFLHMKKQHEDFTEDNWISSTR